MYCVKCPFMLCLSCMNTICPASALSLSEIRMWAGLFTDAEVYCKPQPSNTSQYLCFKAPPRSPARLITPDAAGPCRTLTQHPETSVKCQLQSVYRSGNQHEHQRQHRDLVQINADKYSDQGLLMPLWRQHKQLRSHTCSANHFGHTRNTERVKMLFELLKTLAFNPQNEDCLL